METGEYVTVYPSGRIDRYHGTGQRGLQDAILYATSQALIHRSKWTVGFAINAATYDPHVVISHPELP